MHIQFSPVLSQFSLSLSSSGDVLTINGAVLDFAPLLDGATLPASATGSSDLVGSVSRVNGVVSVVVALPHRANSPHSVRFPEPIDLEGACSAPGVVPWVGGLTEAQIDWTQMITAAEADAVRRASWRASRVIPKLDLVLAMASAGMISQASAISAAGGAVPAEFEPIVAAISDPPKTEVRIRWAGAQDMPRLSPFILMLQQAIGMTDAQVDALFGWAS
jgi:hypothetical protein